jgi:hypothetical protein
VQDICSHEALGARENVRLVLLAAQERVDLSNQNRSIERRRQTQQSATDMRISLRHDEPRDREELRQPPEGQIGLREAHM